MRVMEHFKKPVLGAGFSRHSRSLTSIDLYNYGYVTSKIIADILCDCRALDEFTVDYSAAPEGREHWLKLKKVEFFQKSSSSQSSFWRLQKLRPYLAMM
ncbi:hypothetical protein BGZ47_002472 [Haplosporangium gracile]|nr:hypothetical protein BGZ47_002472 [Haplosporangium gracile]